MCQQHGWKLNCLFNDSFRKEPRSRCSARWKSDQYQWERSLWVVTQGVELWYMRHFRSAFERTEVLCCPEEDLLDRILVAPGPPHYFHLVSVSIKV